MSTFLENNKTNKIIFFSLVIFLLSLFSHSFFNFSVPLYVSGFFLAIFIPGMAISNIFEPTKNYFDKILTAPVFTVFFFTPIYYFITLLSGRRISLLLAFISILIVSICSFIITQKKHTEKEIKNQNYYKFILFGVSAFLLVHLVTTLTYKFVPEIDGYAYITNAEQNISTGIFSTPYRPMFAIFVDFISLISKIPPYWIFKSGMILIQISGIYYLYQIIRIAGVKQKMIKYAILLSFASVPVINLEIDYTRPNVIFISAILPFIYYLSRGWKGEKKYFFFSSIIATTGLLIHEFFIILFLINAFIILHYFYQKISTPQKIFLCLSSVILFFIMLLNIERFSFLLTPLQLIGDFINLTQTGLHWTWWFLGGYSNVDGFNLGWTGTRDVLNYYAYSVSPFLFLILIFYVFILIKKIYSAEEISSLEKIALTLLLIGLFFSEFLPRINFKTLPDRFWPMTSMSLIALSPFVFAKLKFNDKKIFQISIAILILIGIGGSIYIAKAKAGYVSQKEYSAAEWIKNNTPENSLFITQGGSGVAIDYFAKRKSLSPFPSFFLPPDNSTDAHPIKQSDKILKNINVLFNISLTNPTDDNLCALNSNLKAYSEEIGKEKLAKNIESPEFIIPKDKNIYVFYSFDKFNNYYASRQWWRDTNFYGADLSKFSDANGYELVYNDNGVVYIWKKK